MIFLEYSSKSHSEVFFNLKSSHLKQRKIDKNCTQESLRLRYTIWMKKYSIYMGNTEKKILTNLVNKENHSFGNFSNFTNYFYSQQNNNNNLQINKQVTKCKIQTVSIKHNTIKHGIHN